LSVLIQIIGPKKKKHNFHLQNWRTPGRLASLDRRARRRARDVRGRHASRHRFVHARPGATFFAGRLGCARRRRSLGNDVHSLSQGLSDRNESALLRNFLHLRRSGHDVRAGRWLYRLDPALAGIARRLRRDLLADARRLYLGDRRSLSAVRRKICRDQPRHSAFQFQSTLGSALGYFCLWRTARPPFLHLFTSGWRLLAHDARSRRRCIFFGFRRGAGALERSGRAEARRYGVARDYVEGRLDGRRAADESVYSRSVWDWLLVAAASGIFVVFAGMARVPRMGLHAGLAARFVSVSSRALELAPSGPRLVARPKQWQGSRRNAFLLRLRNGSALQSCSLR